MVQKEKTKWYYGNAVFTLYNEQYCNEFLPAKGPLWNPELFLSFLSPYVLFKLYPCKTKKILYSSSDLNLQKDKSIAFEEYVNTTAL